MENGKTVYTATGTHRSPDWHNKLIDARFNVRKDASPNMVLYFATADGFGCSKSRATPEEAIKDMLQSHGYSNIRVSQLLHEIDIGDSVLCDDCGDEYKGNAATGGILVQSKAICPKCAPRYLRGLEQYDEMHLVRGRCPPGMSFHAWVMQLRGGDNTISVKSFKTPDDMLNAIRGVK